MDTFRFFVTVRTMLAHVNVEARIIANNETAARRQILDRLAPNVAAITLFGVRPAKPDDYRE